MDSKQIRYNNIGREVYISLSDLLDNLEYLTKNYRTDEENAWVAFDKLQGTLKKAFRIGKEFEPFKCQNKPYDP